MTLWPSYRLSEIMERVVATGEAGETGVRDLAFLRDRVLVDEQRGQIYGTQIAGVQDGVPIPWPCESPTAWTNCGGGRNRTLHRIHPQGRHLVRVLA